jgi:hypothetical protein
MRQKFTAGNEPVPSVQEAGRASGLVRTSVENLAPLGFDPQTIQSVASRYINYAILVLMSLNVLIINMTSSQRKTWQSVPKPQSSSAIFHLITEVTLLNTCQAALVV